jgi:hypothetical protein
MRYAYIWCNRKLVSIEKPSRVLNENSLVLVMTTCAHTRRNHARTH